jgi:hypothetical protein
MTFRAAVIFACLTCLLVFIFYLSVNFAYSVLFQSVSQMGSLHTLFTRASPQWRTFVVDLKKSKLLSKERRCSHSAHHNAVRPSITMAHCTPPCSECGILLHVSNCYPRSFITTTWSSEWFGNFIEHEPISAGRPAQLSGSPHDPRCGISVELIYSTLSRHIRLMPPETALQINLTYDLHITLLVVAVSLATRHSSCYTYRHTSLQRWRSTVTVCHGYRIND